MSRTVPEQHPAVVLRSHFLHLRSLLAIAMLAIISMAIAIVILASAGTRTSTSTPHSTTAAGPNGTTRYDGGPEEGTRGPSASPHVSSTRYDGGPDEGTAIRAVREPK